jgi:predicted RNase H-like HicB family nuclease
MVPSFILPGSRLTTDFIGWILNRHQLPKTGRNLNKGRTRMKAELTAIIEKAPEGGFWAICPEFPGANGQGETVEEAKESLRAAVALIVEDRLEDIRRGLPEDVIQETIAL